MSIIDKPLIVTFPVNELRMISIEIMIVGYIMTIISYNSNGNLSKSNIWRLFFSAFKDIIIFLIIENLTRHKVLLYELVFIDSLLDLIIRDSFFNYTMITSWMVSLYFMYMNQYISVKTVVAFMIWKWLNIISQQIWLLILMNKQTCMFIQWKSDCCPLADLSHFELVCDYGKFSLTRELDKNKDERNRRERLNRFKKSGPYISFTPWNKKKFIRPNPIYIPFVNYGVIGTIVLENNLNITNENMNNICLELENQKFKVYGFSTNGCHEAIKDVANRLGYSLYRQTDLKNLLVSSMILSFMNCHNVLKLGFNQDVVVSGLLLSVMILFAYLLNNKYNAIEMSSNKD